MTDQALPPLPTGSIDFNALHDAAAAGATDLTAAIDSANSKVEPLTLEDLADLPAVSAKTLKADLLAIAEDEQVSLDHLGESPTNQQIADAITMHRAAAPLVDEHGNLINPPAGDLGDEPAVIGDEA